MTSPGSGAEQTSMSLADGADRICWCYEGTLYRPAMKFFSA